MPRIQFSDVVPPDKRSIRNIPIPNSGKRKIPVVIKPGKISSSRKKEPEDVSDEREKMINNSVYENYYPKDEKSEQESSGSDKPPYSGRQSKKKHWIFGIAVIILIAAFIIGMMTVFASATISITPKSQDVDLDMKITGTTGKEENTVRYEIIKLLESKTVSVPATGEEAVELKASGKIVIYNNFSNEPQRLIVRTRFESPEGLIFRIPESVVVPGKTLKDGVETAGSIEVEVFADEAGEKYNIKKSDFTIPGFKTDATRYKNIYARSSTNMTGGFVGKMKKVAEADKKTALENIESESESNLQKDLASKVPAELTLLSGSIIYKSKELPQKDEGSSALIGKEVTAYAIMLNKQDLSDEITKEYISKLEPWSNIQPVIKDFSLLKVASKPDNLETSEKITLQINGKSRVWANIDTNAINQRLIGIPKKDAAKLLNEFPGISAITTIVRPVWKQSFPDDSSKIHVQITPNE